MPGEIPGLKRVDPQNIPTLHERTGKLRPVQPGAGPSRGDAMLSGAASGLNSTMPIVGGAAGALLTGGNPLGVMGGIAAGEAFRRGYQATMDIPTAEEMPEELRPFFVGGEVLGGSVVPGMAPLAATGKSGIRFVDRIVQSAKARPGAYTAAETSAALGAAGGTSIASGLSGGNPAAELVGGVAGGVLSPGSGMLMATGLFSDAYKRTREMLSVSGRNNRAAAELHALISETGEDPIALAKALRENDVPGANRTSAQLTGSPALQLVEAELARRSPEFGREAGKRAQASLEAMRLMIGRLSATGDPGALREAAQLRDDYFSTLIQGRLAAAEKEAQEAAAKIADDSPRARVELGIKLEGILSNALTEVRRAERALWDQIPKQTRIQPRYLLSEATRIATQELLPTQKLPDVAENYMRWLGFQRGAKPGDKTRIRPNSRATVGQLLIFRTNMLDEARAAAAAGRHGDARILGKLAEAALDDLGEVGDTSVGVQLPLPRRAASAGDELVMIDAAKLDQGWKRDSLYLPPGAGGSGVRPGAEAPEVHVAANGVVSFTDGRHRARALIDQGSNFTVAMDAEAAANARRLGIVIEGGTSRGPLAEARAFSRTLNDAFTRSFVGDALATDSTGAARIPPEALIGRATAGPAEVVDLRLQEIERAVRMGSPEAANELLDVQRRMLRLAASEIVDPNTGQASGPRLGRFLRSNEVLLDRFPEIREILRNVETANAWLDTTKTSTNQAARAIGREAAFARVANSENPVRTVGTILTGQAPVQQFGQLARMAQNSGEPAVEGLRAAVLQHAYERAGGTDGAFSFTSFRRALTEPPRPGQPSTLDLMRRTGVLDADTASRLTRLLDEADKVESAVRTRPQLQSMMAQDNMMLDLVLRMAGSRVASAASSLTGNSGGHSIVIAGAGSRFARQVMDQIPVGRVQEVLVAAAEEPQMMATLLERATTQERKFELSRKLNAWLISLGFAQADSLPAPGQDPAFQQGFTGQP